MEKFKDRPLHFAYAWPVKDPKRSKRKLPPPPFPEAEPWQCSVYYYWWEYLRRHEGYKRTCAQGGRGRYAKLYEDFGNVYAGEFWDWWRAHNWIFAEPPIRQVSAAVAGEQGDDHTLIIKVPLKHHWRSQRASSSVGTSSNYKGSAPEDAQPCQIPSGYKPFSPPCMSICWYGTLSSDIQTSKTQSWLIWWGCVLITLWMEKRFSLDAASTSQLQKSKRRFIAESNWLCSATCALLSSTLRMWARGSFH